MSGDGALRGLGFLRIRKSEHKRAVKCWKPNRKCDKIDILLALKVLMPIAN